MVSDKNDPSRPSPSFVYELAMQSRRSYVNRDSTAWMLDDKLTAYRFAAELGLVVPMDRLEAVPHRDLRLERGTVVKPLASLMSRGVYVVGESAIIDLARNETVGSVDELRRKIEQDAASGRTGKDLWLEERLITSDVEPGAPARDLKFYCFYGVVGLALETVRVPEVRRCWYNRAGKVVATGKYTGLSFAGNGVPSSYYDLASSVSQRIPAPFVRVDLLASPEGAVLNEFTPKPGGASQFNRATDRRMGELMVSAAGRLHADLLAGKSFAEFNGLRRQPSTR
jgi:TupA-like ATPgrasp